MLMKLEYSWFLKKNPQVPNFAKSVRSEPSCSMRKDEDTDNRS